ncbi:class I tRNA ligase family protein [Pectobacteriaceae bacterium C52]|nr:class I tRNA ligase family protein [Pectobacteriaceae bacterium C52]
MKKIIISPPPTPNGRLHIGHLAGPFLRADIFKRLLRMQGEEAFHVSHIDNYQSYVPKKAVELGEDLVKFKKKIIDGIKEDFSEFQIEFDYFGDNESKEYLNFFNKIFSVLEERMDIVDDLNYRCDNCGTTLIESYGKGRCRVCLHDTFLNVCENCSIPQSVENTLDVECSICASKAWNKNYFSRSILFKKETIDKIKNHLGSIVDNDTFLPLFFERLRQQDTIKLPFLYEDEYGISPHINGVILNPWIEIYISHLYSICNILDIETDAPGLEILYALKNSQFGVYYFFGKDNTFYYAFLFVYLAQILEVDNLKPISLKTNRFLRLNDKKVSSSRNNVMWAKDIYKYFKPEKARWALANNCPEYYETSFNIDEWLSRDSFEEGLIKLKNTQEKKDKISKNDLLIIDIIDKQISRLSRPEFFSVAELINVIDKCFNYIFEAGAEDIYMKEVYLKLREIGRNMGFSYDLFK